MNNKHLSWYKEINNNFIIASRAYFLHNHIAMWTRLLTLVNPLGVGHMMMWTMGVNHMVMWTIDVKSHGDVN